MQLHYLLQDIATVSVRPGGRAESSLKTSGIGKDPTTYTAFLPDKDREQQEQQLREQLQQEYELRQQVCMHPPDMPSLC